MEPIQVIYNSDIAPYGSVFKVVKINTISQEIHLCSSTQVLFTAFKYCYY